jgi:hypothetical protein
METIIFYFLISFASLLWLYFKWINNDKEFFQSQDIKFEKPLPLIGNLLPILLKNEGITQMLKRFYSIYENEK